MRRAHSPLVALAAFALALGPAAAGAQTGDGTRTPRPGVTALPLEGQIRIDGDLSDAAWATASPATGFRQSEPDEGEPATQRTEVRFLYDDDALYIGARMFDDLGAEGVVARLVRRDGSADADLLTIVFDTFHDHLGQTAFTINPAGVKGDAYGPGGASLDMSWDAVWDATTRVDSLGWTAEFRIPFSQLRFPRDSLQTWGLQIVRFVNRLHERSHWSWWPINEVGGPPLYGHLESLAITAAPGRVELLPYAVGRSAHRTGIDPADPLQSPHELDYRLGADLKYLLTSNLTLTATLNPDFGQVEVDPAVVNLSAFETFYPERRPFFVEGRGLLFYGNLWCFFCSNTSSVSLFYSRRIGRSPQGAGIAQGAGPYAAVPENTTILGAAKITGRTAGGWSVGVLDAVTSREHGTVAQLDGSRSTVEVEPLTHHFVGRLAKDFLGGNLQVSGMITSVARDFGDSALATRLTRRAEGAGLEAALWLKERTYRWMGNVAFSQVTGDPAAILRLQHSSARYFQRPDREHGGNGFLTDRYDPSLTSMRGVAAYSRFSKESGEWVWELNSSLWHPGFEVNDLAFLTRTDYVWMSANLFRRFSRPTRVFRRMSFGGGGQQRFNFDGDLTGRQMQAFFEIQPHNYWEFTTFWIHRPGAFDDQLMRGGPTVRRARLNYWMLQVTSDARKRLVGATSVVRYCNAEEACGFSAGLDLTYRPVSNVSLSLGPTFDRSESSAQWVRDVDDPTATAFAGRRGVFADVLQQTISMNTRLNVTFTPMLSFELFAQPLISSGDYTRFKEFAAPRALDKLVYGDDVGTIALDAGTYTVDPDAAGPAPAFSFGDPDFNFRSLRGNAVLRWEFRPGSTLFVVWTQSRSHSAPVGDLDIHRDLRALWEAEGDNIFLVKVNYWLGR